VIKFTEMTTNNITRIAVSQVRLDLEADGRYSGKCMVLLQTSGQSETLLGPFLIPVSNSEAIVEAIGSLVDAVLDEALELFGDTRAKEVPSLEQEDIPIGLGVDPDFDY
jgi:hypothetical protein